MDDEEGERHVLLGACVMEWLFDAHRPWPSLFAVTIGKLFDLIWGHNPQGDSWYCFSFYHSRFMAKRKDVPFSKLCVADKLAVATTPWWLYIPMATASGEIYEYMELAKARTAAGEPKYASANVYDDDKRQWYANVQEYILHWVQEHKDGRDDTWTPNMVDRVKQVQESGVQ